MPRRAIPLVAGEYYHVYNRGNNRQPIFFERENYLFFLMRLRERLLGELEPADAPDSEAQIARHACTICLLYTSDAADELRSV